MHKSRRMKHLRRAMHPDCGPGMGDVWQLNRDDESGWIIHAFREAGHLFRDAGGLETFPLFGFGNFVAIQGRIVAGFGGIGRSGEDTPGRTQAPQPYTRRAGTCGGQPLTED